MAPAYRTVFAVAAVALLSSGCVVAIKDGPSSYNASSTGWQARQDLNRRVIPTLPLGTPVAEVIDRLGQPDFTEAFNDADNEFRALFYRTHHVKGDGRTTRDETTPLVFRDGVLHGLGDDYYRRLMGR